MRKTGAAISRERFRVVCAIYILHRNTPRSLLCVPVQFAHTTLNGFHLLSLPPSRRTPKHPYPVLSTDCYSMLSLGPTHWHIRSSRSAPSPRAQANPMTSNPACAPARSYMEWPHTHLHATLTAHTCPAPPLGVRTACYVSCVM